MAFEIWSSQYKRSEFIGYKGMLLGLPKISSLILCEWCIYGKQIRKSFPVRKAWRVSKCLKLIYADLCEPM